MARRLRKRRRRMPSATTHYRTAPSAGHTVEIGSVIHSPNEYGARLGSGTSSGSPYGRENATLGGSSSSGRFAASIGRAGDPFQLAVGRNRLLLGVDRDPSPTAPSGDLLDRWWGIRRCRPVHDRGPVLPR